MKHYIKVNENGELIDETIYNPWQIAQELQIDFVENMSIPSGYEEITFASLPPEGLTKYKVISNEEIVKIDGQWIRRPVFVDGDQSRIDYVDGQASTHARTLRNDLLRSSDWSQLEDNKLSVEKKAEWTAYRQALRDITKDAGWPVYYQFPTVPQ